MTVRTVFFDFGGTIDTNWYSAEMRLAATPALQHYIAAKGLHLSVSDQKLFELITQGLARYHQWRLARLEELPPYLVWRDFILANIQYECPNLEQIADDLMVWIETQYYRRQMRPEIPAVLENLHKQGYKIGLISNCNSQGQVPLNLRQYGIIRYFNPIVLSSVYRRRKPDPAIFHHAARLSNTPASECVYIGDRISRDVVGAKRAGFKLAIQIRHDFNHGESDDGATPDFTINNMSELPGLLEKERLASSQEPVDMLPSPKVRAVLFDADGVLYYRENKDLELNAFIKRHGKCYPSDIEPEINKLRHQTFIGQISFEQYKTAVFKLYGITDPGLVEQGIATALKEKEDIRFFNDTLDTLKGLKARGMYLGIITDTAQPLHVKLSKLERGGVGHLWDSIIPSSEVGVQKPDSRIFHMALQQLGIRPDQAAFVGHKGIELDGARNTGITTVAFNYDPDVQADYYIEKFAELLTLGILN